MATTFLVVKNMAVATLASPIDDDDTVLTLPSGEGAKFPSTYPFHITLDGEYSELREIAECTNRSGDTLTVTRAQQETTAKSHSAGASVSLNVTAKSIADLNTAVNTLETNAKGYTIKVQALTSSPVDAQTVYFGMLPKAPTTSANISKVYIRKAGTIKIAEIYCYSGTAGTNQAWSLYIRKNNTTDTLIATLSVATSERVFSNTGLNISVVAGDYIEVKGVQPTWVTNPLTTIYGGYIYIE